MCLTKNTYLKYELRIDEMRIARFLRGTSFFLKIIYNMLITTFSVGGEGGAKSSKYVNCISDVTRQYYTIFHIHLHTHLGNGRI